ncbi:hypothetical protein GCM10008983_11480 [Lentibacillus halophilus]|uniref:Uncharacterized protein n=1 Tax=Lentibacillus halophilus TaxID=295065 RepID=A0ABP3J0M5_9BACI
MQICHLSLGEHVLFMLGVNAVQMLVQAFSMDDLVVNVRIFSDVGDDCGREGDDNQRFYWDAVDSAPFQPCL